MSVGKKPPMVEIMSPSFFLGREIFLKKEKISHNFFHPRKKSLLIELIAVFYNKNITSHVISVNSLLSIDITETLFNLLWTEKSAFHIYYTTSQIYPCDFSYSYFLTITISWYWPYLPAISKISRNINVSLALTIP